MSNEMAVGDKVSKDATVCSDDVVEEATHTEQVSQPSSDALMEGSNQEAKPVYKTAKRYQWKVDGELAGYVKQAGKLVELMVRNAGHMVPGDQPKWALDMITHLTHEKMFTKNTL
ncbi:unnamed protein product [Pieris macdunnoughi]|uniref:Uncharacterized protein n=1 Tax=Pieris macdunnoughi TaxID=345717 RepID=A0A821XHI3_9NEOP|nr:unnamed protein product [Pieris macdunnoughi]